MIELNSIKLDEEEFCSIFRNPESDHIWMEIKVPYTYFNTEGTSLILLPGFENDSRIRSQELLEQNLKNYSLRKEIQ